MSSLKTVGVCIQDTIYARGLTSVLEGAGYEVSCLDVCTLCADDIPDCVIVGLRKGVQIVDFLISQIGAFKESPKALVVITSGVTSTQVDKLKSLGVNAILSFEMEPEELVNSMVLLPQHSIVNLEIITPGANPKLLTIREWQVLSLLAEGLSVKEIAVYLNLNVKTVEAHKLNLMRKLDLHNKVEVVKWWLDNKQHKPAA